MNSINKTKIQNAIKQVDAIFAFEGFEPSRNILEIDKSVLAGVGSYAESADELIEYVKKNKSVDGFIYSKTVGLM